MAAQQVLVLFVLVRIQVVQPKVHPQGHIPMRMYFFYCECPINGPQFGGTVPNLGDLTTDEYSFVIKCPASCHLSVRRKKLLRLAGEVARRAGGVFRPRVIPQGKQKGRYDPIIRTSRNTCENRQIVPFWLIFVTRLLRIPAQIGDFRAIFLHKTGLLCKILSETFTFWAVRREISGPEREIPSPGISFSGLGIFISGLV